jgi:hypothetical protein
MKEELIKLKTAKLAKEKGFDIPTVVLFNNEGYKLNNEYYPDLHSEDIPAPTQALLQRWLREKHDLHLSIWHNCLTKKYRIESSNYNLMEILVQYDEFDTYEEALEVGLVEALKLI